MGDKLDIKSAFFVQMDDRVLRLTAPIGHRVLIGAIVGLSRESGYCYASDERLAELLYTTPSAIKNTISRCYQSKNLTNIGTKLERKLVFTGDIDIKRALASQSQNETKREFKSQIETTQSQNETYIYIINKYKIKRVKNNLTLGQKEFFGLCFDYFWGLFPKRVKKSESIKLFNSLNLSDLDKLLSTLPAIQNYHDKTKHPENAFIPDCSHPTTFIRGKRWEDDVYQNAKKFAKEGASVSVSSEMEESVQRFKRLSEGDAVELLMVDHDVLERLGMSGDDAVEMVQLYSLSMLRGKIASVWEDAVRGVA